jgi:biotin-[acetyl-CoA-carboxylase] ligase BirA-like protein
VIVYTDSTTFADRILEEPLEWQPASSVADEEVVRDAPLLAELFPGRLVKVGSFASAGLWQRLLLAERAEHSQWEKLGDLARREALLCDGILCVAGSGKGFRGHKDRAWVALAGNVHMSAYLAPQLSMRDVGVGCTILPTLAVVDAIDSLPGLAGKADIKWVNDVLIEGRKVAGAIAQTHCVGEMLKDVIMGIGVNVETSPKAPTDIFVPDVTSLRDHAQAPEECTLKHFWPRLARSLRLRYQALRDGKRPQLLEDYRKRSVITGRQVAVFADNNGSAGEELARGKVIAIGDNLELHLEDRYKPVTRGRLALLD